MRERERETSFVLAFDVSYVTSKRLPSSDYELHAGLQSRAFVQYVQDFYVFFL